MHRKKKWKNTAQQTERALEIIHTNAEKSKIQLKTRRQSKLN